MLRKKLLVIGFVWPEPKSSAAGSRMLQLITLFKELQFEIVFASAAKTSERSFDFNTIGIETASIQLNHSSFDTFLNALNPDVVLFDRFMTEEQFGWRVDEHCPNALKILDTEDFHGLRKGREVALKKRESFSSVHLQNDITKREIASIYRCDLSLIISEAEVDVLKSVFKIDDCLLHYIPFLLNPVEEQTIKQLPAFQQRQHFITVGNFLHPPNYDAVLHLKEKIWPLIKQKLPITQLHIYGAYATQKVSQLHNEKEGFVIKGYADNVNIVMQNARVCLAPLRFGAGLKGKLVDAMQNGTPCVMSSIASEGMFDELSPNGFIADSENEFAEKAVALYTNADLWYKKQIDGFDVIAKRFDETDFKDEFASKLEGLLKSLMAHRQNNFLGQILQHQSLQSTKYMSKWIEAKNKFKDTSQ